MKRITLNLAPIVTCLTLLATTSSLAFGAEPQTLINSEKMEWGAAPPVLPAGAKIVVLAGDPAEAGLLSLRLMLPAGYKIPAHWHPNDEQVTILSGTFNIGMGDKLDQSKGQELTAGGFAVLPAQINHYVWTNTGVTLQLNLMGPFAMTYANPADDPRQASAKK